MNNSARAAILQSIRSHLAASVPYDKQEVALHRDEGTAGSSSNQVELGLPQSSVRTGSVGPIVELFKRNLEAVDGHCAIVDGDPGVSGALTAIITELQKTPLRAQRIALSDEPIVERLMYLTDLEIEALTVTPDTQAIFNFDVGISTAQAAIAETGTLVLDGADERHRLVSLVPPVHIAIVDASRICETLSDVLSLLRKDKEVSPAVTFITGPSRTADIELTLTIGVHGPQELYVIVKK